MKPVDPILQVLLSLIFWLFLLGHIGRLELHKNGCFLAKRMMGPGAKTLVPGGCLRGGIPAKRDAMTRLVPS